MVKRIGPAAAYVTGACQSAIYDFETGKVYSLNRDGTRILSDFLTGRELTDQQSEFISQIRSATGLELAGCSDYIFPEIEPRLDFAWLELTQKCNFRCVHCYQGTCHEEESAPLSVNEWKDVIRQCAAAGCRHIQFIGGEPSICAFLPELIAFAHSAGISRTVLFSNLFFMNDALLSAIVDYDVFTNFSIYGACAAVHDHITQVPGSFDRLISRVTQLRDLHVSLRANVVLMRENEGEYEAIREFLRSLRIDSVHYDEIRKIYGGAQSPHMLSNPVLKLRKPNFRTDRASFEKSRSANTCWHGKFSISTDGSVYPCEFERNNLYGNIRQTSIAGLLKSDMIKKYWYFSFDEITPCRNCEYRFACKDCRPMAYGEHGCLTDQNPRCCYDPAAGKWA